MILIGPMGSGKSTIGRALAKVLGLRFVDLDEAIVHHESKKIPEIFEQEGEPYFRQLESKLLSQYARQRSIVLATGGGAILDETNRATMKAAGKVIYLKASAETLYERTKGDTNRPLLNNKDPFSTLTSILRHRAPYYESTADVIIETDHCSLDEVVTEIKNAIE